MKDWIEWIEEAEKGLPRAWRCSRGSTLVTLSAEVEGSLAQRYCAALDNL
jgi:hypothetical protein